MAGKGSINAANYMGSSDSYKSIIDAAAKYRKDTEVLISKQIADEEARIEQLKNGKSAAEKRKLTTEFNKWKKAQTKKLDDEEAQYLATLSEVQLNRDIRNAKKLLQEKDNLRKQDEVDGANSDLARINYLIELDAQLAGVRSKSYLDYVNLMLNSDAIRAKAAADEEKKWHDKYVQTLAKDPNALKAKLSSLKTELKEANKLKDKDRANELKKDLLQLKTVQAQSRLLDEADARKDIEDAANALRQWEERHPTNGIFTETMINDAKNEQLAAKLMGDVGGQIAAGLKVVGMLAWNKTMSSVDDYLQTYTQNFTSITTRLQNSGYTYEGINKLYKQNTAANPYVRYDKLLTKLNELVEEGIATNVAQRAFLGTIAEEVATTFDATQASLLQIVRIQQSDTTAQRLGLEANLTRLFNFYFGDTSYLSNAFDSVQQTLIGTSAQMSSDASIEFEYIVQKWLGSLGSVGVDTGTLQTIAQGINYLGTGNVEALSGNAALQNLLVMSANRAGLNYGNVLTGGLSSTDTNKLLKSLIEYVQEISSGNNNVVKSAYADLFGVSIADMAAFLNLKSGTISSIYNQAMTSNDTITELQYQLGLAGSRYHLSTKIQNVLDNTFMGIGMGVANSAASYGLYKAADMLEKITGGINLPFISAFGTGIDLNMSLEGLVKTGVVGFSALGSLVGAIGNIFSGPLNLNKWGLSANKGEGFRGFTSGNAVQQTTSSASYVSNSNATGTKQSLVDQQKAESSTVNGEEEQENPFSKKATDSGGADYWTNILLAILAALDGTLKVKVTDSDVGTEIAPIVVRSLIQ